MVITCPSLIGPTESPIAFLVLNASFITSLKRSLLRPPTLVPKRTPSGKTSLKYPAGFKEAYYEDTLKELFHVMNQLAPSSPFPASLGNASKKH